MKTPRSLESLALVTVVAAFLAHTGPRAARAQEPTPAPVTSGHAWCPPLPEVARDIERRSPGAFTVQRGLKNRLRRARQNQRLARQGVLEGTPQEIQSLTSVSGTIGVPVFLGNYADVLFIDHSRADFQTMLFDGPTTTGTMVDYYEEVSYGMLNVVGTVYDWFEVSQNGAYYFGASNGMDPADSRTHEFIHEVLAGRDGTVDFRQYDNDGPDGDPNSGDDDGYVDFAAFVHYDRGGETGDTGIWSHRGTMAGGPMGVYVTNDPAANGGFIKVDGYTIMPALNDDFERIEISIFCHEFGHAFGLLDLYDNYDLGTGPSAGIGSWGIMGSGVWDHPESPPHYCAYSKAELGWISPGVVTSDLFDWPLQSSTLSPTAMRLWAGGDANSSEYFLVEYRTQDGFDQWLPAPGVLVWHVDEASVLPSGLTPNFNETKKRVDLECADQTSVDHFPNADDLDGLGTTPTGNLGDAGDPFCDGDVFGSTFLVDRPSSVALNGEETGVEVHVLTPCAGDFVATDLIVGVQGPTVDLCIRDCTTDVCAEPSGCENWWASPDIYIDNKGDGKIDAPAVGLTNRFWAIVRNIGTDPVSNTTVDLYVSDPSAGLTWPGSASLIGSETIPLIGAGGSERVSFDWVIPPPPGNGEHYCFGAVASSPQDPPLSQVVIDDNNVAQVNIQELYAKAGNAPPTAAPNRCDGASHDRAGVAEVFTERVDIQLCNPSLLGKPCNYEVKIGSPPLYDDAVIPDDWEITLSTTEGLLGLNACTNLEVTATDLDAHHLDYAIVPITMLCDGMVVGGNVLEFHVDNYGPAPICGQFSVAQVLPPEANDDQPWYGAVHIQWDRTTEDTLGWPEDVERWRVYRGNSPSFFLTPSALIAETCLDARPESEMYEFFADIPSDPADTFYKLVSVDRAGNESVSCVTEIMVSEVSAVEEPLESPRSESFVLERPEPNPMDVTTRIAFRAPPGGGTIRISVFDSSGRRVARLFEGHVEQGRHDIVWNGSDDQGRRSAAGVYYIHLTALDGTAGQTRKVTLQK